MTRKKKSRKVGSLGKTKSISREDRDERARQEKRQKKRKGFNAGSRHNVQQDNVTGQGQQRNSDPRHGSKKPVALVPEEAKDIRRDLKPQVKLKAKEVQPKALSPEKELAKLEANERLNALLDRLDEGDTLAAEEQSFVDKMLSRINELMQELGIDDEEDLEPEQEPDLYSRFENAKWEDD